MDAPVSEEELREQVRVLQVQEETRVANLAMSELRGAFKEIALSRASQIMDAIEETAVKAVRRVDELVESKNEDVATRNSHFVIDHVIGKSVQKSLIRKEVYNIDVLAD